MFERLRVKRQTHPAVIVHQVLVELGNGFRGECNRVELAARGKGSDGSTLSSARSECTHGIGITPMCAGALCGDGGGWHGKAALDRRQCRRVVVRQRRGCPVKRTGAQVAQY